MKKFAAYLFALTMLAGLMVQPIIAYATINDAISYYAFDESSGDASDSSGNSKTLTNTNTVTYGAAKIANGASLASASTQYFTRSNGTYYDGTSGTANCWFKGASSKIHTLMQTATNISAGGFIFSVRSPGNNIFVYFGAGNQNANGATALTVNGTTWYMVTATWNTSRKEVFLNATSDGANETDETMTAGQSTLSVGRANLAGGTDYLDGVIDECGVWNRVLSGAEITALYNAGAGKNPYAVAAATFNPWQMSDF